MIRRISMCTRCLFFYISSSAGLQIRSSDDSFLSQTRWGAVFCCFLLACLVVPCSSAREVFVSAESAAIMDDAGADAQELGRAVKGTRLRLSGRTVGDWVQIEAPSFVSGWVYGELVRNSVVAASTVKVRSGPGIGHPSLGTLQRDDPVVVRGRRGDWVEIEGQPALLAWVERAMVAEGAAVDLTASAAEKPEAPKPTPTPATEPAAGRRKQDETDTAESSAPPLARPPLVTAKPPVSAAPVAPVKPPVYKEPTPKPPPVVSAPILPPSTILTPKPVEPGFVDMIEEPVQRRRKASSKQLSPVGIRLLPSAPQGEPIEVTGILRPVGGTLFAPAPYRLVIAHGAAPARTVCYVKSDQALPLVGSTVRLRGLKYWVYGSRHPVILLRDIDVEN